MPALGQRLGTAFSLFRTILDSGLGLAQDRVETLAEDLEKARARFFQLMLGIGFLLILLTLGLSLLAAAIVAACWQTAPIEAMLCIALFYLSGAFLIYRKLAAEPREGGRLLSRTIDEIKQARACLQNQNCSD
jgi:uncharacterized membrane protein YqjE